MELAGNVVNHVKADPERDIENRSIFNASFWAASPHCMMNLLTCCWHQILARVKEACCGGEKVLHCTICRFGRVIVYHGQKILLTEEREVDQIFWFRFGRRYLVFELVLFSRLESCFAVIGLDFVSIGYKYEPPIIVKDWYTTKQQNFTLFAIYFSVGGFSIFFFLRVLSS